MKLKRCHIDTICLVIIFTVGVFVVNNKINRNNKKKY